MATDLSGAEQTSVRQALLSTDAHRHAHRHSEYALKALGGRILALAVAGR